MIAEKPDVENIVIPFDTEKMVALPVNSLLAISGNSHRYQRRLLIFLCVMYSFYSFIYIIIPILFYMPQIYCNNSDGSQHLCSEAEACLNKYGFDFANDKISLITKFNLICDKKYMDLMGKNYIYFFSGIGCLIISYLSDYYGRKFMLLVSGIALMFGVSFGLTDTYNKIIVGVGFCYCAMETSLNFSMVYCNETVGSRLRSRIMSIMFLCGCISLVIANLQSFIFSSYKIYFILPGIVNGILTIMYFYLVETPYYLAKTNQTEKLFQSLSRINEINYSHDNKIKNENKNKLEKHILNDVTLDDNEQEGTSDIVKDCNSDSLDIRADLEMSKRCAYFIIFCVCIISVNLGISFSLLTLSLQHFGNKNLHLNGICIVLIGTFILSYSIKYAPGLNRKFTIISQNTSVIFLCLSLFMLKYTGFIKTPIGMGFDLIFSAFIAAGGILVNCILPSYEAELLPTKYRGLACGLELFACKMSYMISTYLNYAGQIHQINPMTFCFIPAMISLVAVKMLPDTNMKK